MKSKCVTAINFLNSNCLTLPDLPEGTTKYTDTLPVAPNTIFHPPKHKSPSFQIILLITKPSSSSSSLPFALTTGNPLSGLLSHLPRHIQRKSRHSFPPTARQFFDIYPHNAFHIFFSQRHCLQMNFKLTSLHWF